MVDLTWIATHVLAAFLGGLGVFLWGRLHRWLDAQGAAKERDLAAARRWGLLIKDSVEALNETHRQFGGQKTVDFKDVLARLDRVIEPLPRLSSEEPSRSVAPMRDRLLALETELRALRRKIANKGFTEDKMKGIAEDSLRLIAEGNAMLDELAR